MTDQESPGVIISSPVKENGMAGYVRDVLFVSQESTSPFHNGKYCYTKKCVICQHRDAVKWVGEVNNTRLDMVAGFCEKHNRLNTEVSYKYPVVLGLLELNQILR